MGAGVDAVIFDWGGTLTPWHDIDFEAESRALAAAVIVAAADQAPGDRDEAAARLLAANQVVWGRARDHQQSGTVEAVFAEAGLALDPELLGEYRTFWEPHTFTDPEVEPMFRALREAGVKVGILSNTVWPREWHRDVFRRDGVLDLIDGDVYSSELAVTKPDPAIFEAAMAAVGTTDPTRCVYVGDRLFEDVWGAQQVGMRAVLVPHSVIPTAQVGHSAGEPDAVAERLGDVVGIVAAWS